MSSHDQVITGQNLTMTEFREHFHREHHIPRVSIPTDQDFGGISPKDRLLARASSQSVHKKGALSEKALEAKRRTNRQSAKRCRLRQKLLIKELEEKNALLTMKNTNLMLKLELSDAENRKLRLMMQEEEKKRTSTSMKRNQELQELHLKVQKQLREQRQSLPSSKNPPLPSQTATTASALLELAGAAPTTPELVSYQPPPPHCPTPLEESRARVQEFKEQLLTMLPALPNRFESDFPSSMSRQQQEHDVLSTQQNIHELRREVKGLRDYLARRKSVL